ncbi:hypothetical protein KM043_001700 [Ampulex compressa]|nr:hypothetical protein KM043_001700 [Ampulex compressa]
MTKMTIDRIWAVMLCCSLTIGEAMPTGLMEDVKDADQAMRPKPKRAQEMLMFGNQQNRQSEGNGITHASSAEKRTLSSSGLSGLKAALAEDDKQSHPKSAGSSFYDHASPYDKSYDDGKVLVNELDEEIPRVWDVSPYSRYYMAEDRRKRSEKAISTARPSTVQPPTTPYQVQTPAPQWLQLQAKRSVPIYQEPRFKRDLNIDPEDVLTLLSLWENERRNRNEEYDNLEEDGGLFDDEDPRGVTPWMGTPVFPPGRHYGVDALSSTDIGIVRTHPPSYYEQYGKQYSPQYEPTSQYGAPQYGVVYPQRSYYNAPEKRFMVSRKRAQSYDPYSGAAQLQIGSQTRGYPYQHRLVY